MTDKHGERATRALPADLADIENALCAVPAQAPAALLARILATRAHDRAVDTVGMVPVVANSVADRRVSPLTGSHRRVIALAAVITVAALSMPWLVNRQETTAKDMQETPKASTERATYRDDVARLLQPFPASAQAQMPTPTSRKRPPRTTVAPTAVERLTVDTRIVTRIRRDVGGRELSRSRREVRLDTVWSNNYMSWVLSTRGPLDVPADQQQIDSIMLDPKALYPFIRRLYTPTMTREFRFMLGMVTITDSIGYSPTCILSGTQPSTAKGYVKFPECKTRVWDYRMGTSVPLERQRTLALTEEHLALLLRTVPLSIGWSSTVAVPGPFAPLLQRYDAAVVTVRVVQLDTVQTAKGPVPCYRVTIDYGQRPDIWWISVATGEFVRGVRTTADPVTTETTTLERIEPRKR